ncbi:hypothetical protein AAFF_G00423400 [Aldrovandia affinis]|uniref:Uncharacterized protein n=1 Tax=Aldrovandia affinis TaxID=143900 RepID=A0AAD7T6P2_9TELE|nr:hypothetical protein AAFF_G00423400 [Aldrovandia affinis]
MIVACSTRLATVMEFEHNACGGGAKKTLHASAADTFQRRRRRGLAGAQARPHPAAFRASSGSDERWPRRRGAANALHALFRERQHCHLSRERPPLFTPVGSLDKQGASRSRPPPQPPDRDERPHLRGNRFQHAEQI